jgi:hypothetical protein
LIFILFFLMVVGSVPTWPHSRNWGYFPSGGIGLVQFVHKGFRKPREREHSVSEGRTGCPLPCGQGQDEARCKCSSREHESSNRE